MPRRFPSRVYRAHLVKRIRVIDRHPVLLPWCIAFRTRQFNRLKGSNEQYVFLTDAADTTRS